MSNSCGGLTVSPIIEEFTDGSKVIVGYHSIEVIPKQCECCGANGIKSKECEYCGQIII